MKKKLLALALAAIMACSLLAPPALAAEELEISCTMDKNGLTEIHIPEKNGFGGNGTIQVATYSARGQFLDFQSVPIAHWYNGYDGTISMKVDPNGTYKMFLTEGYNLGGQGRPKMENFQGDIGATAELSTLLLTVTKGAAFGTGFNRLSNIWRPGHDDYVGAEPQLNADGTEDLTFYVNGRLDVAGAATVDAAKGDVAKLYDRNYDGKVDTVKITHYCVAKVTDSVRTQKDSDGRDTVLIPGVTSGKYVPASQVSGPYADLQKDDIVLFYTNGETDADKMVVTVEIPESFTGKVTGVNQTKGQLIIGGSAYDYSAINGAAQGGTSEAKVKGWNDLENEYTFYLDKNGGLCYCKRHEDPVLAKQVAVVLESRWIMGGTIDASNYMQAKLMLANGDVVITPIDRVGMSNCGEVVSCIPTATKTPSVDFVNKYVNYATITGDSDLSGSLSCADGFWRYKVNANGHYEITNLDLEDENFADANRAEITDDTKVEQRPYFTEGVGADNSTVFLVETYDKSNGASTFEIFTGYANVPVVAAGNVLAITAISPVDEGGMAKFAAKYAYIKIAGHVALPAPEDPVAIDTAVVLESRWIAGGTIDNSNYMQAKLMLANGDVVIAPIYHVGVKDPTSGETVSCALTATRTATVDFANRCVNYAYVTGDSDLNGSLDYTDGFWRYEEYLSGYCDLTNLEALGGYSHATTLNAPVAVVPKPAFTDGLLANANTVFMTEMVDRDENSTFEIFTGYANVPAIAAEDVRGIAAINEAGTDFAKCVYIKAISHETVLDPDPVPVASGTAVVLESRWIMGGTIDASNYMQAKLMLANGDVVITPIDRVGVPNNATGEIVSCIPTATRTPSVDFANKCVNYATVTGDSDLNGSLDFTDGFWRYEEYPNGYYGITKLADLKQDWDDVKLIAADVKIEKKPAFTAGQSASANTVFMIEKVDKDDNSTFEVYTGYTNVPAMNAGTCGNVVLGGVAIHEMNGDVSNPVPCGQAAYVYIKTRAYADKTPEGLVFLRSDVIIKNAIDEFTIEIVDGRGEVTTMKKDSNLSDLSGILKMYTVDAVTNGVVTDMTEAVTNPAVGIYTGTLRDISGGVVAFNEPMTASDGSNATACAYDDSTTLVLIDLKYKEDALAFDSSTVLEGDIEVDTDPAIYEPDPDLYVIQDDGLASYIYIVRMPRVPL